jgi:hypothetical protein
MAEKDVLKEGDGSAVPGTRGESNEHGCLKGRQLPIMGIMTGLAAGL